MLIENNDDLYLRLRKVSENVTIAQLDSPTDKVTFTSNYSGECFAYLVVQKGTVFNNLIACIKIEEGSTKKPEYSPHTLGSTTVVLSNKNLIEFLSNAQPSTKIWYGGAQEARNVTLNSMELWPMGLWGQNGKWLDNLVAQNKNYTISANFTETVASSSIVGMTVYGSHTRSTNDLVKIAYKDATIAKDVKTEISFTFNTGDYKYILVRFWGNYSHINVVTGETIVKVSEIQLEEGMEKTEFVEHQEKKYIIPTQQSFKAINSCRDEFVK